MGPRLLVALSLILVGLSVPTSGQGPTTKTIEEFDASLGYQTGTVALSGGMVTIRLPESFRFIGPDGQKAGFEPVRLVGWAESPSYDRAAHKMYWARELAFGESDDHTLNYAIRVLGRPGVLVLNAVASIDQLDAIRQETKGVMAAIEFNEGHRYTDYLPGKDKAASYGIAGLILGATATKAGLFKVLIAALLAFKKGLLLGVVALGALVKKLFTKKPVGLDAPPPLPR